MKKLKWLLKRWATWHVVWAQIDSLSFQAWNDSVPWPVYNITEHSEFRIWQWVLEERTYNYCSLTHDPIGGKVIVAKYPVNW